MLNTRRFVIGLLLITLAGGSWWLTRRANRTEHIDATTQRNDPDYIIERFVAHRMNERGTPKYVLSANLLTHYPKTDVAYLVMPVLVQYLANDVRVTTRADSGVIPGDGSEIVMKGNVHVIRTVNRKSLGGEVRAEQMRVELDRP